MDVAVALERWIDDANDSWGLGRAIVGWAKPYRDRFDEAWLGCPRADYLAALAALGGVDMVALRAHTCVVARAMAGIAPDYAAVLGSMASIAEAWTRGEALPPRMPAWHEKAALDLSESAAQGREQEDRRRHPLAAAARAIAITGGADALVEAMRTDGDLFELTTLYRARHRRAAAMYAMRACTSALVFARIADDGAADAALLSMGDGAAAWRKEATIRARSSRNRLASMAADVYRNAGLASAWREGATEGPIRLACAALAVAARDPAAIPLDPFDLMEQPLLAWMERAAGRRQRVLADALRARVPLSALSFPGSSSAARAEQADPRVGLREARVRFVRALDNLSGLAVAVGAHDLAQTARAALAVLQSNAPLERTVLLSLVTSVQIALADSFRGEAAATTGAARRRLSEVGKRIDADLARYRAWLTSPGGEPLD